MRLSSRRWFANRATADLSGKDLAKFVLSLERSVGARQGVDEELSTQGGFNYEVYPDLPVDTDWRGFFGRMMSRQEVQEEMTRNRRMPQRNLIKTVGCQTRSREALREKLLQNARDADGLLLLSGSHPAHKFAAYLGRTPSSTELLKVAKQLKQEQALPPSLNLWAVENPLCNPAARLASKLDAGAETVLTQPPLLWDSFAVWWDSIHRMGLTEQGSIVVGVPMITSIGNLQFWLHLCNASSKPEAALLLHAFKSAAKKEDFSKFLEQYNADLISKVMELPGLGGLHVMPLTKTARKQVLDFQSNGLLPNVTWSK